MTTKETRESLFSDNDSDCSWISVEEHALNCQCNICAELEPFALYQVFRDDLELKAEELDKPNRIAKRAEHLL